MGRHGHGRRHHEVDASYCLLVAGRCMTDHSHSQERRVCTNPYHPFYDLHGHCFCVCRSLPFRLNCHCRVHDHVHEAASPPSMSASGHKHPFQPAQQRP
jgi:hypothetical protein